MSRCVAVSPRSGNRATSSLLDGMAERAPSKTCKLIYAHVLREYSNVCVWLVMGTNWYVVCERDGIGRPVLTRLHRQSEWAGVGVLVPGVSA